MGKGLGIRLGQVLGASGAIGEARKEANQSLLPMLSKMMVVMVVPFVLNVVRVWSPSLLVFGFELSRLCVHQEASRSRSKGCPLSANVSG